MYIYLDESGDLGFDFSKKKTTKKFVVTLLVCENQNAIKEFEKAVKRTLKNKLNHKKNKNRVVQELKGTTTTLEIKKYFYNQLKDNDWKIYSLIIDKQKLNPKLRTKSSKHRLYNVISRLILEKLPLKKASVNARLVVDRSKNRSEINEFNHYIQDQLEYLLPLNIGFKIVHLTSQEMSVLQAVDLFCWGIFRKYEFNDCLWYNEFKDKIIYKSEFLPENTNKKSGPYNADLP